ncbi:MAG: CBS domain-containing protein [Thiogranum sp.]|jgi:CBS domain-containing protein
MTTTYETISAGDSLYHAALVMRDEDVGMLPVVADNGSLLGAVTDRDIVVRGMAEGREVDGLVADVMTPGIICCDADDDIAAVARMMEQNQVRRVMVTEGYNAVVGVISLGDIATRTRDRGLGGELLERISRPTV